MWLAEHQVPLRPRGPSRMDCFLNLLLILASSACCGTQLVFPRRHMRYVQCRAGGVSQPRGRDDRSSRRLGQVGRDNNRFKFEQPHERSMNA
jgi:hypothetical protein